MFERDMDTIIVSIAFIDNLFIEKDSTRRRNQTVSTVSEGDEEDVWLSL